MRRRSLAWMVVSLLCFIGALYFWRLGNRWAREGRPQSAPGTNSTNSASSAVDPASMAVANPIQLLSTQPNGSNSNPRLAYRLSNTAKTAGQLGKVSTGIILENALIDTANLAGPPVIPQALRANGDPGAYIVQSKSALDNHFRTLLKNAGAAVVAYVPNNAYLVRVSSSGADLLRALPETQAVLPYEPYYKLKSTLLRQAVKAESLAGDALLNVLLFAEGSEATEASLRDLGAEIIARANSSFGPVVTIKPPRTALNAIAGLAGVQEIEMAHRRAFANDLSRQTIGAAIDSVTNRNYLDLSGSNIIVNVNDSGVDLTHPDLAPRVFTLTNDTISGTDPAGHGTHVAGIIASSGGQSLTVTGAQGSVLPPVDGQFRGKAPLAKIFSINVDLALGTFGADAFLQESAAQTNAYISNNSWHFFGDFDYGLGAASYDAAVRDALPGVTGSQPVVYVFPVGSGGAMNEWDTGGNDNGVGGLPDTIQSPGTAKNVITVGAVEQFRNITNDVRICTSASGCTTNKQWQPSTDGPDQVARFSNRGNVAIGFEGDFGRFKPDIVAPGSAIVSTRSGDWDEKEYYNPTNHHTDFFDLFLNTNEFFANPLFISDNALSAVIEVFAPVDLPIFVKQPIPQPEPPSPTNYTFVRTNIVQMPPDHALTPLGIDWWYGILNDSTQLVSLSVFTDITTTNDHGDFLQVLSNMNNTLGPFYRYESGSSMAAASVSGTLALMEEFFEQRIGRKASPALLKAMLINGARSVNSSLYDFQVTGGINYQGWGLINLPNSLPGVLSNAVTATSSSMFIFDQGATNSLATGERHTRFFSVSLPAQEWPLRATLVWTDPPGNPAVGIKLVNNLDLVVTNLETGEVFFGNDFRAGTDVTGPWDTNAPPNLDFINNVENVYIPAAPRIGTNFSVTVVGRQVNVNAVTTHPNGVVQDFALVVSSGDGQVVNGLTFSDVSPVVTNQPAVTYLTNGFPTSPGTSGNLVMAQRVGASSPLQGLETTPLPDGLPGIITVGVTNQWHFFVVSNDFGFTNVAFVTFLPPDLALPRLGVNENTIGDATRIEADVELYVSRDRGLTNLQPAALAGADKSLSRGGTEMIVYSNAPPGGVYYVGIKSEDQMGSQFAFLGIFSQDPFSTQDAQGNVYVRGLPVPAEIPDGTAARPGAAMVFGIAAQQVTVRRVIVTNTIAHELTGDLLGNLSHNHRFVVLNNHTCATDPGTGLCYTNYTYIYDDSGENNVTGARPSDGPGSLKTFIGEEGVGLWLLTEIDNAPTHTGRVENVFIKLEPQNLTNGVPVTILPNSFYFDSIDVPIEATNLVVCVSGNNLPVDLFIRRGDLPTLNLYDKKLTVQPPGGCLTNSIYDLPPLTAGRYFIGVYNPNAVPQTIIFNTFLELDLNGVVPIKVNGDGPIPILDDAVTYSKAFVTNHQLIAAVEVGLRVDHPRVSDLVFTLISPSGTRILLSENRGNLTTDGMGGGVLITNVFPTTSNGDFNPNTNTLSVGQNQGTLIIDYDFLQKPDDLRVYYDGNRIFDSGLIGGAGRFTIDFGPGISTDITILMNEGGNADPDTIWQYTATVVSGDFEYLTFTENTNFAKVPIKFAVPPFTSTNAVGNLNLSGFEVTGGEYTSPNSVETWSVGSNQVSVITDATLAAVGNGSLALGNGQISQNVPTVPGKTYTLNYAYRGPEIVSWWRAENNAFDSVSGLNGTFAGQSGIAPGEVGQAFIFNPADGGAGVNVPDSPLLMLTNSLTIEGWIYVTNQPSHPGMVLFRGDTRGGFDPYALVVLPNNLQFVVENAANIPDSILTGSLPLGQWLHVAATLEDVSGRMRLYTNGVLAVEKTTSIRPLGPLSAGFAPGVGIGNHSQSPSPYGYSFPGRIDEVSVYKRAISASEVRAIYMAGTSGKFNPNPIVPTPENLAEARVSIGGITNVVNGDNDVWKTASTKFVATLPSTPLIVQGLHPGMLLDNFNLSSSGNGLFYFPEETLNSLVGENAFGEWRLEILDTRAGATNPPPQLIRWQLRFIFENTRPAPIKLDVGVTGTNSVPPGGIAYFVVDVPYWASFATNIMSASGPVNLLFNQFIPPTGSPQDTTLLANVNAGLNTLTTTNFSPTLRGSRYYLGVQNPGPTTVSVSVRVDFDITPLTNAIPLTALMPTNNLPRYFSYDVSTNAGAVSFELLNVNGNLDLVARKGTPVPDLFSYDYRSMNLGSNDEDIVVFTNTIPVALSPGTWYLGVFNRELTNVNFTILATEYPNPFPTVILLTNAIAYANTNTGGANNKDYYQFVVSPNAVRAQFEINNPSGDMALVARKGLPLADLGSFDLLSANPGTSDELIVFFDYSTPVRLTPGNWFLTAVNVSGGLATYSIKATEYFAYGTNLVITNWSFSSNGFCFSWSSLPGTHYFVQGLTNLSATQWTTISTNIIATDFVTTYCIQLPSIYSFFRIGTGLSTNNAATAQISITSVTRTPGGVLLQWIAPTNLQFNVQWTASIPAASWNTFTNVITSTNGNFSFLDDGSQSGGLGVTRFYRLRQLP